MLKDIIINVGIIILFGLLFPSVALAAKEGLQLLPDLLHPIFSFVVLMLLIYYIFIS